MRTAKSSSLKNAATLKNSTAPEPLDADATWVKGLGFILSAFSHSLDSIEKELRDTYAEIDNKSDPDKRRRVEHHARGVQWVNSYERPLTLSFILSAISIIPTRELLPLIAPWNTGKLLTALHNKADFSSDYDPPLSALPKILGGARAMLSQVNALLAFQRSMSDLVADARNGDDSALFLAVRVDPAVLVGKTGARRFQLAVAVNDKKFLSNLTSALRMPVTGEFEHARLQAALVFMAKAGQIPRLNERNAAALFIKETRLYAAHGSKDPQRSLWRYIQRWKQTHATLIRK